MLIFLHFQNYFPNDSHEHVSKQALENVYKLAIYKNLFQWKPVQLIFVSESALNICGLFGGFQVKLDGRLLAIL